MKRTLLSVSLAVTLSGCSMIPDFQRPESPVADSWPQGEAYSTSTNEQTANLGWGQFFQDPALRELIGVALENNRDLRVAALNVEATRALYRIQRSDLFPSISADGSGNRSRTPASLNPMGEADISSQYSATLGIGWELDLFGRLGSLREQALEEYLATEAAQRSVQISLIAAVANTYLTWQADQALLEITRGTLETYEESLSLTQRSYDVGVASSLELTQARTAVETARSSLARYTRLVAQDRNALAQLLGQRLPFRDVDPIDLQRSYLTDLPVGLPSELLVNRPDIVEAERRLRAANANIGAARAAFFPSISLTGAAGSASSDLDGLFDSGSDYWSFSPSISLPIFNAGRLRANLDYAEIIRDARVAEYERSIQEAFRDVSDGLAARDTYVQQVQAQSDLVEASESYFEIAERRYRTGVDSYLTLLDAQRQLFTAQQQLIGDRLSQLVSEVELFKALGGGWQAEAEAESIAAQ
ncbi:AdeC/AdeK/OprM family multidrug efflux complex outer membrane factor [Pseudomonas sp. gcc21]|uniref:AdeC/AdeK/OprM family multidrug efflux complex outer membrane factor n=1 Tax=Pseudomonas sp. gcc21 TaxID=2726989 RepID=UPI00145274B4|nr:AdeC/AdeK/OprM family multidrug efflux complex outer membrane factor [Pseudomonas sp. gcc21]QJD59911.1 AdeC/AdeK/OprM family multidrug efflux complex outer membrane factor [Pseudomonas sp. gcc21]